ncbi:hypothetical protein AMAG_11264 [Allomyces macrogynus ATCC 38327]|uniref:Uncharacterized protein n=1 Tax=Allomyces macrogynus (strain ATCC 38327) TaxID=578462 RepID=A0A0L0SWK3_ALLM3|nr:hypothetical protein AMAG_11264 [Allomyces macrogynus ATCC 38327]|eukprot:KNE66770.1 hypothetical protein AMAG_11264 [Allomyces macrogynus ATCC 38327]
MQARRRRAATRQRLGWGLRGLVEGAKSPRHPNRRHAIVQWCAQGGARVLFSGPASDQDGRRRFWIGWRSTPMLLHVASAHDWSTPYVGLQRAGRVASMAADCRGRTAPGEADRDDRYRARMRDARPTRSKVPLARDVDVGPSNIRGPPRKFTLQSPPDLLADQVISPKPGRTRPTSLLTHHAAIDQPRTHGRCRNAAPARYRTIIRPAAAPAPSADTCAFSARGTRSATTCDARTRRRGPRRRLGRVLCSAGRRALGSSYRVRCRRPPPRRCDVAQHRRWCNGNGGPAPRFYRPRSPPARDHRARHRMPVRAVCRPRRSHDPEPAAQPCLCGHPRRQRDCRKPAPLPPDHRRLLVAARARRRRIECRRPVRYHSACRTTECARWRDRTARRLRGRPGDAVERDQRRGQVVGSASAGNGRFDCCVARGRDCGRRRACTQGAGRGQARRRAQAADARTRSCSCRRVGDGGRSSAGGSAGRFGSECGGGGQSATAGHCA